MEDVDVFFKERLKKLEKLRELGINPYPYKYNQTHHAAEIIEKFGNKIADGSRTRTKVSIAGRLMTIRSFGSLRFAVLKDQSASIQVVFNVGKTNRFDLLEYIDVGDILGIEGVVMRTKRGELSVEAHNFEILCKSLRTLPEKFHGLQDVEIRYRQRYLDLIMNDESREIALKRSLAVETIREILLDEGFIEFRTPTLQPIYGGASAQPFKTYYNALKKTMYMRISNELYLKRLLVGGFERVFEFSQDFRNEGVDATHNPEFVQVEWYQAYGDYYDSMKLFERVYATVAKRINGTTKTEFRGHKIDIKPPWKRLTMVDAIKKYAGINVMKMNVNELRRFCKSKNIEYTDEMTWGLLVNEVFEELCEDKLIQPTFLMNHPIETTPLCKPLRGDPRFVERFEPYIGGIEIGNAYSELNEPILQKKLLLDQVKRGRAGEEETHPMDEDFIRAIEQGMPPATGVGMAIERMLMVLTGNESIREVILFPILKKKRLS
jgi:lysyl-tRNA synthetase class 2